MWFGVIFIRHGLYQDGVFKFTVYIPDNYPDGDCPVSRSHRLTSRAASKERVQGLKASLFSPELTTVMVCLLTRLSTAQSPGGTSGLGCTVGPASLGQELLRAAPQPSVGAGRWGGDPSLEKETS